MTNGSAGAADQRRERPLLHDAAVAHQHDDVGQERRLADVVGHDDDRLAQRPEDAAQVVVQLGAHQRIERAQRLVEQQHLGVEHQRAHDRDPLPLAARQLVRVARRGRRPGSG